MKTDKNRHSTTQEETVTIPENLYRFLLGEAQVAADLRIIQRAHDRQLLREIFGPEAVR